MRSQPAAIVEHSNDAIFRRTFQGLITTWNAAAARICWCRWFWRSARRGTGQRSPTTAGWRSLTGLFLTAFAIVLLPVARR